MAELVSSGMFAGVAVSLSGLLIFIMSLQHARNNNFYGDTFWLWPWGVYVWGDGLILGPWWMLSGVVWWWLSPVLIIRFLALFWLARAFYETVYWILHQASGKDYQPPLFRSVPWLNADQAGILYQLLNMCQVVGWAFFLVWSLSTG